MCPVSVVVFSYCFIYKCNVHGFAAHTDAEPDDHVVVDESSGLLCSHDHPNSKLTMPGLSSVSNLTELRSVLSRDSGKLTVSSAF